MRKTFTIWLLALSLVTGIANAGEKLPVCS